MKRCYINFWIIFFLISFAEAQVPQYSVTMTQAHYESLYTRSIWSDDRLPAAFTSYGITWSGSTIRLKGHSTRYYSKKSFRVRFPSTQLYYGLRDINLNAMYIDKSLMREKLAWDLYADLNAVSPSCHHANFKINNETKGLFAFIEKIDKYFLLNKGFTLGNLYSAEDYYTKADLTIQPDSLLKLYYSKEVGTDGDYEDLKQMIYIINTVPDSSFASTIIQLFDTTSVLNWFVVNTLTMMGDCYNKNYHMFNDTTRASQNWIVIPWDYDLSWGRNGNSLKPYPSSLLNDGFVYTYSPLSGPSNTLKNRWISTPELKEKFRLRLKYVLDNFFLEVPIHNRIDSLASLIENEVFADPYKWGTSQDFYEHVEALKYFTTVRRNYLYKTYINPPSGKYNTATLRITQTNIPYHFVTYDGRTIASMWLHSYSGLDSINITAYPDSTPPFVNNPSTQRFIKRWLKITPYPSNATFSGKIQFMYNNYPSDRREVGLGVQDEKLLKANWYNGSSWESLPSKINSFANTVTIENINHTQTGSNKFLSAMLPEYYTQKWFKQPNFFWQRLYDVKFQDYQTGYAIGEHGTFLKTTDGGVNWIQKQIGMNLPFYKFTSPNQNTFYAVGEFGSLYKSINNGDSWTKVAVSTPRNLMNIKFVDSQIGWAAGNGVILKTTDGGSSWINQTFDSTICFYGIATFDQNELIVAGSSGKIARTTDNGLTWQILNSGVTQNLYNLTQYNESLWAVGENGTVLFSSDRGSTWINKSINTPVSIRSIVVLDMNNIFAAGSSGKIYYTQNNGDDWYTQYTAISHDLFAMSFVDSSYGIAVGNDGTILKTTEPGTITDSIDIIPTQPIAFKLFQNYPNPFNSSTTIEFDIPVQTKVVMKVYNILGQEVTILINDILSSNKYIINFDGTKLASGVYFYRLETGEGYVQTKKLLLLK